MSLIYPYKQSMTITKVDVTQQQGHDDCGLFAIAFAQSLCRFVEPGCLDYAQIGMRDAFKRFLKGDKLQFDYYVSNRSKRTAHEYEIDFSKKFE